MNTLDLLMKRAEQSRDDKLKVKKVKSEALGGEILLKKPPFEIVSRIMDEADSDLGFYEAMKSNAALIYEAWPEVKNNYNKLKEAYEVGDPYDLIIKIFDNHINEIETLAQEVMSFYGFDFTEQVKN